MSDFLLASMFGGLRAEDAFWWFFIIAVGCYVAFSALAEESPWVAFAASLASAVTIILYSRLYGDKYWFLEWGDGEHWLRWIVGFILTIAFLSFSFRTAWEHLKLIGELFSYPLLGIVGVVAGLAWLVAALYMLGALMVDHTFAFFLILIGACGGSGSAHVPTIYVEGEGHITGRGYNGGDRFHGDNGNEYRYDGSDWHRD